MKNLIIAFLITFGLACPLHAQEDRMAKISFQMGEKALAEKQYERAIHYLSRAVDKNYIPAFFTRGIANHYAGKYEDAIKDFDKCIENNYKVEEAKRNKELAANEQKKIAKTETKTDFGSGVNSEYMSKQFYKEGMNSYAAGDLQKALGFFNSAVGMNPSFADAYAFIALINSHLKNFEEVIKACDKAFEMKNFLKDAKLSQIYFGRGNAYCELEKLEEALKDLNEAIKLDYMAGEYYTIRGVAQYKLENKKAACEDWNLATKYGAGENANKLFEKYCK